MSSTEKTNTHFGIRSRLVSLFTVVKVIPILIIGWMGWQAADKARDYLEHHSKSLSQDMSESVLIAGNMMSRDASYALENQARLAFERLTTDTAAQIADFLYSRDDDIRLLGNWDLTEDGFRTFLESKRAFLTNIPTAKMNETGDAWVVDEPEIHQNDEKLPIPLLQENGKRFSARPAEARAHKSREPLYLQASFINIVGQEEVKVTLDPLLGEKKVDVSVPSNTFLGAEKYFSKLKSLKPGEVYVSPMVGEYIGSDVVGAYTLATARDRKISFSPQKSAYAGLENPLGRKFRGIIRWATPVTEKGKIKGWVTLAFDHRHLMEFSDYIIPDDRRYARIPDPSSGNYAFILDHKGRTLTHPRNYYIVGFDAETGERVLPWLDQETYVKWQNTGLQPDDFLAMTKPFYNQSFSKKPSSEQVKFGKIPADCRFLNFAPQCSGWFNLTQNGGSGSFQIYWDGLWKLNTAAAIPYYTGIYGESERGFGVLTIGVNARDFNTLANQSRLNIHKFLSNFKDQVAEKSIETSLWLDDVISNVEKTLIIYAIVMITVVILIATFAASWITKPVLALVNAMREFSEGKLNAKVEVTTKDELGQLSLQFNEMVESFAKNNLELMKLKQAVEQSSATVVITDLKGNIEYVNKKFVDLTGYGREEVIGKNPRILKTGQTAPDEYNNLWRTITNGDVWKGEFLNARKDGTLFWESAIISPIRNEAGAVIHYLGIKEDITEKKWAEERLRASEARLKSVLNNSPSVIFLKDLEGRYEFINSPYEQIIQKKSDDVIGKTDFDLFDEETARNFTSNDQEVIEAQIPLQFEEVLLLEGFERTYLSVKFPLLDSEGALTGICGISTDISARKEVERMKNEFISTVSHELRTPLTSISGSLGIVKGGVVGEIPQKAEEMIGIALNNTKRLINIINDLLDIEKYTNGKVVFTLSPQKSAELVTRAVQSNSGYADKMNVSLVIEALEKEAVINVDPNRFGQVMDNLLSNAIKFSPAGATINVSTKETDGRLLIAIRDQGPGIPDSFAEHVFQKFTQVDSSDSRHAAGTGLGLPICKTLVEKMEGSIWFENNLYQGATFYVDFPLGALGAEK